MRGWSKSRGLAVGGRGGTWEGHSVRRGLEAEPAPVEAGRDNSTSGAALNRLAAWIG